MSATSSLGELLVADRADGGVDLDDLSRQSGFAIERIAAVESGRHDLSDDELSELLDRYAAMGSSRRPIRALVEIDLDAGSLRLHRTRRRRSLPSADQNLLHYLSMLHRRFDLELGAEIPLKAVDLSLLRASLALRRDDVSSRLDRMSGAIRPGLVRNRSLLVAAVATGLVVTAGAIVLIPAGRSATTADPSTGDVTEDGGPAGGAVQPQIDIGTPLVVERQPSQVPGAPETGTPVISPIDADPDIGADRPIDVGPQIDADPDIDADAEADAGGGQDPDADGDAGLSAPAFVPSPETGSTVLRGPFPADISTPVASNQLGPRGPPLML